MEITFESIKGLIVHEQWAGSQVNLKFKATNQDQPMDSMGIAMPNQEDMMKRLSGEVAKSAASGIAISAGANALGNLTGVAGVGGALGSAASQAGLGYQMDTNKLMQVDVTEEVRQETILNAFKSLSNFYRFENNQWVFVAP